MIAFMYLCLITFFSSSSAFEFKAPYISVDNSTINTLATYTIYIQRQFTQNVTNTPWNTVIVPAGS